MSISTHDLSISFNGKPCLSNVQLTAKSNQLTILIGPNGAGKSTLLKACCGDFEKVTDQVYLNGKSINHYSAVQLAQIRAVMTQSYDMGFSFSVYEIVAMGCYAFEHLISRQDKAKIIKDVMNYMSIAHLSEQNFLTLSGGEKQRTQLARVLAQLWFPYQQDTPRYLLLDEPTSSLDIFHQHHVLSIAKTLTQRNIGVLAVIHDLSLAANFADQLILLNHGKVIAQGNAKNVLQRQNLEKVYGIKGDYFHSSSNTQPTVLLDAIQ
ncbi:heme ABC transporter ATP-binding protein [Marinomonas sp. THO17]|uniref:heme ABC transporter ATP-binding protein n=1 Tax=Marinomonas sp. THO17 TaxID=3149048 RepID=UPI00336C0220